MADITLTYNKSDVLDEVRKTSAYIGAKSQDIIAYDKIALINANDEQLDRFWDECCADTTDMLAKWLVTDGSTASAYSITLRPSMSWITALQSSLESDIRSALVNGILAKWLMTVGSAGAEGYAQMSAAMLQQAENKLHRYQAPTRTD